MRVPEVRGRLRQLAVEHGIEELFYLADELHRRKPVRRAPVQSAGVTDEIRVAVAAYAAAYPDSSFAAIGHVFRLNPGRVSEIIGGKRE